MGKVQTTESLYGNNHHSTMFLAWGPSLDQDLASVHNASIFADSQSVWMRIQLGVIGPPRPKSFLFLFANLPTLTES